MVSNHPGQNGCTMLILHTIGRGDTPVKDPGVMAMIALPRFFFDIRYESRHFGPVLSGKASDRISQYFNCLEFFCC